MSDFLLDFRDRSCRMAPSEEAKLLRFFPETRVTSIDNDKFFLALSRTDDLSLWGSYVSPGEDVIIGLTGRIALDSAQWSEVINYEGEGGLACKAIHKRYLCGGVKALGQLNGSFVVIVYDKKLNKIFIITDRCGMSPCFQVKVKGNGLVFCSHPDILAQLTCNTMNWDMPSFAEFLSTGKLSHPYTYYKNIRALNFGCIHTIDITNRAAYESEENYFSFDFRIDHNMTEWNLAEELALAFKNAVTRRTHSIFGQTGISLSGGLDSRAILCSAKNRENIWSFCFFDEENYEYRVAKEIAHQAGVRFIPLKRNFDYYGENAAMGVKISGGMGDFGNNHYLGFREALFDVGISNVIAGFYCDYLFKGLVLNKRFNKILRIEKYSEFTYDNYMPFYEFDTVYYKQAKNRLDEIFSNHARSDQSDLGRLKIEARRLFPLSYEPDNQETLIPQRVMGWYLPTVDNDIIEVYLKVPPNYKLNTSMYSKTVEILCGKTISRIPNVNTGASVNASRLSVIWHSYQRILLRSIKKRKKSIATDESWPNWMYYIANSKTIRSMWQGRNKEVNEILSDILGLNPYGKAIKGYAETQLKLFLRLLTLKLWFDQRK